MFGGIKLCGAGNASPEMDKGDNKFNYCKQNRSAHGG